MYLCATDEQFINIQQQIRKINDFLSTYSWLTDAYVLDFFTESHWNKLPETWSTVLDNLSTEEIASFMSLDAKSFPKENVLPLSLQAYRKTCQILSHARIPFAYGDIVDLLREMTKRIPFNYLDKVDESIIWKQNASEEFGAKGGHHFHIDSIFSKHIKPKKQHEIYRLSKLAEVVLKISKCTRVVDVGSGQGHLSRYLSLISGFKVLTIEGEGCHIDGAKKIDKEVVENLVKKNHRTLNQENDSNIIPPSHKIHFLSSKSNSHDFLKILQDTWGCDREISDNGEFSLLGLHTCGNLAPTILKTFIETKTAKSLLSVGCCYLKTDQHGFPMSDFVKRLPISKLSYESKEVSCHAVELFLKRLRHNPELLHVHCYRSTLEAIIVARHPDLKRAGLRSIKHVRNLSFVEYAAKALSKQSILIPVEDFDSPLIESRLKDWKKVLIFYCLRLLIAPVIESLILLDRMMYLYQSGISSCIVPIFDPKLSPRNLVLVSIKS